MEDIEFFDESENKPRRNTDSKNGISNIRALVDKINGFEMTMLNYQSFVEKIDQTDLAIKSQQDIVLSKYKKSLVAANEIRDTPAFKNGARNRYVPNDAYMLAIQVHSDLKEYLILLQMQEDMKNAVINKMRQLLGITKTIDVYKDSIVEFREFTKATLNQGVEALKTVVTVFEGREQVRESAFLSHTRQLQNDYLNILKTLVKAKTIDQDVARRLYDNSQKENRNLQKELDSSKQFLDPSRFDLENTLGLEANSETKNDYFSQEDKLSKVDFGIPDNSNQEADIFNEKNSDMPIMPSMPVMPKSSPAFEEIEIPQRQTRPLNNIKEPTVVKPNHVNATQFKSGNTNLNSLDAMQQLVAYRDRANAMTKQAGTAPTRVKLPSTAEDLIRSAKENAVDEDVDEPSSNVRNNSDIKRDLNRQNNPNNQNNSLNNNQRPQAQTANFDEDINQAEGEFYFPKVE